MINVIAAIEVKPGCREKFLEIFKANVPNVLAEQGCIRYEPNTDTASGIPVQVLNENLVTILETWESLPALHAHLQAPHMADYRQKVKDMVLGMKLSVLSPA
ncbi:MAG: antibiotic biosynthesis monooxygenase [Lentisphaerae bacterium GWF2_52_8]|nr:MAG: antibiotic biosynthesis monooxygenase [Lentisphaerae bacterium GWF2_52_8]